MIIIFIIVANAQANEDHALYSDAHVLKIERQMHDKDYCSCTFVVRFEYDDAEVIFF